MNLYKDFGLWSHCTNKTLFSIQDVIYEQYTVLVSDCSSEHLVKEETTIKTYLKEHNKIIEDVGKIETNWRKSCLVPVFVLSNWLVSDYAGQQSDNNHRDNATQSPGLEHINYNPG